MSEEDLKIGMRFIGNKLINDKIKWIDDGIEHMIHSIIKENKNENFLKKYFEEYKIYE